MNKFFLIVLLALTFLVATGPSPARAESLASTAERKAFYQFNPKRVDPAQVDKRLKEVTYRGLVLWVAKSKVGKPTVMYMPGSGGNLHARGHKFRWFLDQGYGVVAMSYPGMGGSKGQPSRQKIQSLADQLYRDIPKLTGSRRIVLMGESLGTGVAVAIAAGGPGRANPPTAIILQAPYTSLVDLTAAKNPILLPSSPVEPTCGRPNRISRASKRRPSSCMGKKTAMCRSRWAKRCIACRPPRTKCWQHARMPDTHQSGERTYCDRCANGLKHPRQMNRPGIARPSVPRAAALRRPTASDRSRPSEQRAFCACLLR